MFERMLDKHNQPTTDEVIAYLGADSFARLEQFEAFLQKHYHLKREMRFPFGSQYGWGYKYSHQTVHLCFAFFEAQAFTISLQLGDTVVEQVEQLLPSLSAKTQALWEQRYPCGDRGGWIHARILEDRDLQDGMQLVLVKKKPVTISSVLPR